MYKLSICIPTYNRSSLLRLTLEHLLCQVNTPIIEVLISDNDSTDDTSEVVNQFSVKYNFIKYYKNEKNIGLDENTFACINRAQGEYIWLLSDDDIPLHGVLDKIISVLNEKAPVFVYLHHAGFLEPESYEVVFQRNQDLPDKMYSDPELMIKEHKLNHFSSIITQKALAEKYFDVARDYEKQGSIRGYCLVITNYIVLNEKNGSLVYIGKLCLAVRNPLEGNNYNPITTIIDIARNYQTLRNTSLITKRLEHDVLNWYLRGFYLLVVPRKCKRDPHYSREIAFRIFHMCKPYRNFWIFMFPFLVLPRWVLFLPYLVARTCRRFMWKYFKSSPF